MSRICTICAHPERAAIDQALVAGEPVRTIVSRYVTVGRMAVQRHKEEHLPKALVQAQQTAEAEHAIDVVKQLKIINQVSIALLHEARQDGKPEVALKAIDRVQRQIELQAKLLGDLDDRPQVNVMVSAEWVVVRTTLLGALAPHPAARADVARALLALEHAESTSNGHQR